MLLAAGCAPPSYLVLLEQDDGKTGSVIVTHAGRSARLDQAGAALALNATGPSPLTVDENQIRTDFAAAMQARPQSPQTFVLYFEGTTTTLTTASAARIADIRASVRSMPAPDVSIVGHTDRAGDDKANEALGLERAKVVRNLLADELSAAVEIAVTSHGERNPLVPTADGVLEPRNRRVEITVR
ncbi:OmpA family protein [Azoarcus sp. L1K30]|uniref:OmpA family protein n=1 Tax=Azoarcus sp. L1K30 TaxID=2820277 RepID=UPI001B838AFD|nr:OmpA family protein [Azoarcus sp. L1K30]MBR0566700.1 OmpA family protein [Azoarcus sp. L1K30]